MRVRIALVALGLLVATATGGLFVWYMAYGVAGADGDEPIPVLADVADLPAALSEIGRQHATYRTWPTLLLRQVATGRLSEWYGADGAAVDARMLALGFAARSRASMGSLSADDAHLLSAYTEGINSALQTDDVRLHASLVLLDVVPDAWEPWHALSVERLVLWLQDPPVTGTDSLVQRLVGWWGGRDNMAWADEDGTLSARFLTGTSAVPLFMESDLTFPDGQMTVVSIPGTPMIPAGRRYGASWAFLLRPAVNRIPPAGPSDITHLRFSVDGNERLVEQVRRTGRPDVMPAPGTDIAWSGLAAGSDISAWFHIWRGQPSLARWSLMREDGLVAGGPAGLKVSGDPNTVGRLDERLFVSSRPADSGPGAVVGMASSSELSRSTYSAVAASAVPDLLNALPDSVARSPAADQALTYLRNWNFNYDGPEIGATLFDALSRLPDDTPVNARLEWVVRNLSRILGPDMSRWRWADRYPTTRTMPGWVAADQTIRRPLRAFLNQYTPVVRQSAGHPTSLQWHTTPEHPATSAWEGLIPVSGRLSARRPNVHYDQFLGRTVSADSQ